MKKERLTIIAVLMILWTGITCKADNLSDDYSGKADTLTKALVSQFLNPAKGTFWAVPRNQKDRNSKSRNVYWQQAHAMDALIYSYERIKEKDPNTADKYKRYMGLWYENHANNWYYDKNDPTGFVNDYTDDMCWICLTLLHMSEALNDDKYADTAYKLFNDFIVPRGSTDENGIWALPWKLNYDGRGACTNSPGSLVASKLYLKYNEERHKQTAIDLCNYMFTVMKKYDNDGRVEEPPLSYTQGTFGEACRVLYHITGEEKYLNAAQKVIHFLCSNSRCTDRGLLRNEGQSMDQSIFKAVAVPYIVNFILDESTSKIYRKRFTTFLEKNANTLWSKLKLEDYPRVFCPYYWGDVVDPTEVPSMGAMTSGVSLMENMARLALAQKKNEATGISIPKHKKKKMTGVYTLDGRKVQNTTFLAKGIYVVDNQKVMIRK